MIDNQEGIPRHFQVQEEYCPEVEPTRGWLIGPSELTTGRTY